MFTIGLGDEEFLSVRQSLGRSVTSGHCKRCNAENADGSAFCRHCGFDLKFGQKSSRPGKGKCWFCGKFRSLSKEHPLPSWLLKASAIDRPIAHRVMRPDGYSDQFVELAGNRHGKNVLAGWAPTACFSSRKREDGCNGGWMSDLQNDAKIDILPLTAGSIPKWPQERDVIIARWCAMVTASMEYFNGPVHISQSQREMVKEGNIPEYWVISEGLLSDALHSCEHYLSAFSIGGGVKLNDVDFDTRYLSAFFIVGRTIFHLITQSGLPESQELANPGTTKYPSTRWLSERGLQQFWPPVDRRSLVSGRVIDPSCISTLQHEVREEMVLIANDCSD